MLRYLTVLCIAFLVAVTLVYCEENAKQPALLLRCPSLSPDGSTIAFEYEGDIMTTPISGGEAVRLTIDVAHESNPVFSPDGVWIAYSANHSGFSNIYVIPAKGGASRRLTWFNAEETPTAWSPDGKFIYFHSHRDRAMTVYRVPFSGGTPSKLVDIPNDPVYGASPSPDGTKLLINYRASVEDMARRGNFNPGAAEIYLAENAVPASNFVRITNNDCHEFFPTWSPDGRGFYYISDADGSWNLYRKDTEDSPRQLTHFSDKGVGRYAVAAKAGIIVTERNHRLCRIDPNNGIAEPIDIVIAPMQKFVAPDFATEDTLITDYAISPDNKKVVFVHKHDLFVMAATGGYVKQLTRTAVRECHPSWSPDSQYILFNRITYAGKDIVRMNIADGSETALTSGGGNFCTPLYSPDGKFIAYHYNFDEIRAMDADGGNTRTLVSGTLPRRYLLDERWFNFTSDGKFMCYLAFNDIMRQECMVKRLDENSPPVLMSYIGGHSYAGAFSKDYSFFVYANPWFDKPKIYLVDLKGVEPPLPPDTKDALDKVLNPPDPNDKKDSDKTDGKQPDAPKPPVELPSLTDIAQKTHLAAPSVEGSQDCPVLLPDGKTMLFVGGVEGDTIYSIALKPNNKDAKPIKTIAGAKTKLKCDSLGTNAYFICAGSLYRIDLTNGSTSKITPDKIMRTISAEALRYAILDEYLWHLRSAFYDTAMHGVDLDTLRARYIPLIASCTTDEQFEWLMDEVSGEFNASHMGFFREKKGKDRPVVADIPHLGFMHDDVAIERGELRVRHIVKGSPAARKSSGLMQGDKVVAVNGREIVAGTDVHSLLWINPELVELTVVSDKAGESKRTVRYTRTSVAEMIQLCHDEWIDGNRRFVATKSGGTLGYIYIQNMMQPDYDHLKSELEKIASTTKGAVLDFRYNGGGFVAFKVVELLKQQHFAFTSMRGGKEISEDMLRDFIYPHPVAGLFNFASFSNAEMMLCAFSTVGLGVTIGTPTAGGVIGTWGRQLPDGTWMRLPQYKVVDAGGRNLERSPTRPQIVLNRDLSDMAKGIDPQIERAISELLDHSKKKGD